MTNEKKAEELRKTALPNPLHDGYGMWLRSSDVDEVLIKMAEWKDLQIAEAKELLRLCYNTILGITSLDTPEEIAKARKSHDSSLIKRIELFMYNNQ